MSAGARVFEYINLNPTIPISGGKVIPYHSFFGNVEFRNVSFSYPTRFEYFCNSIWQKYLHLIVWFFFRPDQIVIENLSLKIGGGQTVRLNLIKILNISFHIPRNILSSAKALEFVTPVIPSYTLTMSIIWGFCVWLSRLRLLVRVEEESRP